MRIGYWAIALVLAFGSFSTLATAGPRNLNDTSRSIERTDVAPIKKADEIPFETIERNGLAVSYNLQQRDDGLGPTYRLVLIFRNDTGQPVDIEPQLTLLDGSGLIVQPFGYEAFRTQAFALAGSRARPIPASSTGSRRYEGTITNTTTGDKYSYTGKSTSTGSFSDSFAKGYAIGAQAKTARNLDKALNLIQFADSYWLLSDYTIPNKAAVSGAVLFPGSKKPVLPMRVVVEIAREQFEFETASKK